MVNRMVTIGDKIDLKQIFRGDNSLQNSKTYASKVLDFIGNDKVKVSAPIKNGNVVPLEVGTQYEMVFFTNQGIFQCKGEILDRYKENNLYILVFCFLTEFEKKQRRQFYRIECLLDIKFRILSDQEWNIRKKIMNLQYSKNSTSQELVQRVSHYKELLHSFETTWISGTVLDISGGGARFNVEVPGAPNQVIELVFSGSSGKLRNLSLYGNVISIQKVEKRYGMYEYRIEYIELEKSKREKIIKFIFEEERRIRQREKGLG